MLDPRTIPATGPQTNTAGDGRLIWGHGRDRDLPARGHTVWRNGPVTTFRPPFLSSPPLEALFQAPTVLRIVLAGEALAAVLALSPAVDTGRLAFFGLMSLFVQWVLLLSLGVLYLARHRLRDASGRRLAWVAVLTMCLVNVVLVVFGAAAVPAIWPMTSGQWVELSIQTSAMMAIIGVISAVAFDNHVTSQELDSKLRSAELEALQARIHPHFLFNTLNSAAALVHARPDDAERVLLDLSDLFRAALSEPGWVPLSHELALCRRYLAIEQLRFGERLQVAWDVSAEPDHLQVPLLAVQPLVENAVAHGLDDRAHGRHVRIAVSATATSLEVAVANPLPQAPTARTGGHGIGLAAVRARIEVVTAGQGRLEAGPAGTDFVARVVVPRSAMPQSPQATIS